MYEEHHRSFGHAPSRDCEEMQTLGEPVEAFLN